MIVTSLSLPGHGPARVFTERLPWAKQWLTIGARTRRARRNCSALAMGNTMDFPMAGGPEKACDNHFPFTSHRQSQWHGAHAPGSTPEAKPLLGKSLVRSSSAVRASCAHQRRAIAKQSSKRFAKTREVTESGRERFAIITSLSQWLEDRERFAIITSLSPPPRPLPAPSPPPPKTKGGAHRAPPRAVCLRSAEGFIGLTLSSEPEPSWSARPS